MRGGGLPGRPCGFAEVVFEAQKRLFNDEVRCAGQEDYHGYHRCQLNKDGKARHAFQNSVPYQSLVKINGIGDSAKVAHPCELQPAPKDHFTKGDRLDDE